MQSLMMNGSMRPEEKPTCIRCHSAMMLGYGQPLEPLSNNHTSPRSMSSPRNKTKNHAQLMLGASMHCLSTCQVLRNIMGKRSSDADKDQIARV
ncbi:hypothetical protein TNCV_1880761 [Trichonephila clavipes]|nr:hypothetical protein TNCV_1880761 [Trichonephila clavipes]